MTRIKEYHEAAAQLASEASLGLVFRHLSTSRLVTIAQVEGRTRGAGSEFVMACDMRFAASETAIFAQPETALGLIPGAGGVQHLTRLMGRARALEVMLGAEDYSADSAERYGWINRALPSDTLDEFVNALAHRIARFPAAGLAEIKRRVNAIALADVSEFCRDSDIFVEAAHSLEAQGRLKAAMTRSLQTPNAELDFARLLGEPPNH